MNYKSDIGKIYDTIFFFLEYFNKTEVEDKYIKLYDDTDFMVECYREVADMMNDVPAILQPFFYMRDGVRSPITSFFATQIDIRNDNFESFIAKIKANPNVLLEFVWNRIFEKTTTESDGTASNYADILPKMYLPIEFKFNISLLLGNFEYGMSVLTENLCNAYICVEKLHKRYEAELQCKYRQIKSPENTKALHDELEYELDDYETTTISICLLHQYVVLYKYCASHDSYFMFGFKYEESMDERSDEIDKNLSQFFIGCGNELRLKIIDILIERDEVTTAQLSEIMGCSNTTITRHISVLYDNRIVNVSKRQGMKIYYKLNKKFIKVMQEKINKMFERL